MRGSRSITEEIDRKHALRPGDEEDSENKITGEIIGAAIEAHKVLGPGLLKSDYEECLCHELGIRGIALKGKFLCPWNIKE